MTSLSPGAHQSLDTSRAASRTTEGAGRKALGGYDSSFYNWPQPTTRGWSAADEARGARNALAHGLSPARMLEDNNLLYASGDRLIAHRGLVDLARGIPENSVASVNNAVEHNINAVEMDVQSTSDGVAVPLHDNALDRTFGGERGNVQDVTFQHLAGRNITIKSPPDASGASEYTYTNQKFQSLQDVMTQTLRAHPGLSIVLDPKNLGAAKAAIRLLAQNSWMAPRVIMKTYANYWGAEAGGRPPADVLAEEWRKYAPVGMWASKIKIDPVINPGTNDFHSPQVRTYIDSELREWAQHFEVPQVEIPGYWKAGWTQLAEDLEESWQSASAAGIGFFRNNAQDANGNRRTPNVGTGYRFEDFAKNGRFYDWDMNGQAKEDVVDATRRTAGAEKDASGWLTTDVPLEEANAIVDGDSFAPGNARVDG